MVSVHKHVGHDRQEFIRRIYREGPESIFVNTFFFSHGFVFLFPNKEQYKTCLFFFKWCRKRAIKLVNLVTFSQLDGLKIRHWKPRIQYILMTFAEFVSAVTVVLNRH